MALQPAARGMEESADKISTKIKLENKKKVGKRKIKIRINIFKKKENKSKY